MPFYVIDKEMRVASYGAPTMDRARREALQIVGNLKNVDDLDPALVDQLFKSMVNQGRVSIHQTDVPQRIGKPLRMAT